MAAITKVVIIPAKVNIIPKNVMESGDFRTIDLSVAVTHMVILVGIKSTMGRNINTRNPFIAMENDMATDTVTAMPTAID